MIRQERRIQKAIDELCKICDDGLATGEVIHTLDKLRTLETFYASASLKDVKERQ
jgi:hypothetical protein